MEDGDLLMPSYPLSSIFHPAGPTKPNTERATTGIQPQQLNRFTESQIGFFDGDDGVRWHALH